MTANFQHDILRDDYYQVTWSILRFIFIHLFYIIIILAFWNIHFTKSSKSLSNAPFWRAGFHVAVTDVTLDSIQLTRVSKVWFPFTAKIGASFFLTSTLRVLVLSVGRRLWYLHETPVFLKIIWPNGIIFHQPSDLPGNKGSHFPYNHSHLGWKLVFEVAIIWPEDCFFLSGSVWMILWIFS